MSTEEKKAAHNAEALSGEDMSGIAGGGVGGSKGGRDGGGEFLVGSGSEKLSEAEMSGVAGGASKGGSSGGAEFLVGQQDKPHRIPRILLLIL